MNSVNGSKQMKKNHKITVPQFILRRSLVVTCWLALLVNLVFVLFFFYARNSYHVDEMFSFGHANSTQGAFLRTGVTSRFAEEEFQQYLWYRWIPGIEFHNWLTVQPKEAFKYGHIFDNLSVGVHPPLFYILLHTVCSFTPDVFSKWHGAVLNIPLWLLLLWMLFKLAKLFFKDSFYAWCTVLLYAYSEVGLDTVLFIRGYLLQTLLAVCLVYQVTRILKENKATGFEYMWVGVVATLGMLTHYNFLIFAALVGLIAGGILCVRKEWKLCWRLGITLLASVCLFIVLFPPAIDVLINSNRGRQALQHYTGSALQIALSKIDWKTLMSEYLTRFLQDTGRNWLWLYIGMVVVLMYKYMRTKADRLIDWLFGLAIVMGVYTSLTMPYMWVYTVRYTMVIYPLMAVVTMWYLTFIMGLLVQPSREKWTKWIVGLLVLVNSWNVWSFKNNSPFSFHTNELFFPPSLVGKRVIIQGRMSLFYWMNLFSQAKAVYWIPWDAPFEEFSEELGSADMFLRARQSSKLEEQIFQLKPVEFMPPALEHRLLWVYTFRLGKWAGTYDQYRIRDKISPVPQNEGV